MLGFGVLGLLELEIYRGFREKGGLMAGKIRQKTSANAAEVASLSLNERILKECHTLYTDPENGTNAFRRVGRAKTLGRHRTWRNSIWPLVGGD